MKLWSWLFNSLAAPTESAPVERGTDATARSEPSGAVAVADPPGDPQSDVAPWWKPTPVSLLETRDPTLAQLSGPVQALENLLISHFDGHDLTMPTLHNMAERALPRLRGTECNLAAVAADIAEDPVLTAALLRTVNSPFYRGVTEITSVHRAVTRLGVKAVRALLMHQSLRGALFERCGSGARFAEMLWQRSLASACIMRGLAGLVQMDEEDAYLLGLLHDIGCIIVLRLVSAEEKNGFAEVDAETFEYLCRQAHQEFGELIAESWKLPGDIKTIIACHHDHPDEGDAFRRQRLMLILTNMILPMLGYAPTESYNLLECRAAVDLGLGHRNDYRDWLDRIPLEIEQILAEA